jgi:hypothetical protein
MYSNITPKNRQAARPTNNAPTKVIYTASELSEVKFSRADVAATALLIATDRGWRLDERHLASYSSDKRIIYTTAELNEQVERLL